MLTSFLQDTLQIRWKLYQNYDNFQQKDLQKGIMIEDP